MRHGSTPALLASFCLAASVGAAVAAGPVADGPAPAVGWILPDQSRGFRVAPLLLLSRPEIQAELRMKPDQVADAERVIADARHKATQLRRRTDQAAVELRRAVDDEQRTWLETKLTEDQVGRLGEIDLQWEGPAAIVGRPAVAEALSLSPDQRAALGRAHDDLRKHAGGPDGDAAGRRFAQQVRATLSDGQRRRWEKMLGRPLAEVAAAAADRPMR